MQVVKEKILQVLFISVKHQQFGYVLFCSFKFQHHSLDLQDITIYLWVILVLMSLMLHFSLSLVCFLAARKFKNSLCCLLLKFLFIMGKICAGDFNLHVFLLRERVCIDLLVNRKAKDNSLVGFLGTNYRQETRDESLVGILGVGSLRGNATSIAGQRRVYLIKLQNMGNSSRQLIWSNISFESAFCCWTCIA